jgi:predicted nuclease of restriction endonuclease-like RecB superfamily
MPASPDTEAIILTGPLVRVRYGRDRIIPYLIDAEDAEWLAVAGSLIELFEGLAGKTRGEMEDALDELYGDDNNTLVHQGLAKLLEDRCDFEADAGHPPEELRREVFQAAVNFRNAPVPEGEAPPAFDRAEVLRRVAAKLSSDPARIDAALYADLKSEHRVVKFDPISSEHLLLRYNVALCQAILLRASRVHVTINDEPPVRWRSILRRLKFHRLLCEMDRLGPSSYTLHLDGPLSLFSATNKYGLQLAMFLPAILPCKSFELKAELRWGAQKKPKVFHLTNKDGLVWPGADPGQYVPAELGVFVESFRKRAAAWELKEEAEAYPLGNGFWVPDFRLVHRASGRWVLLEVLGFWRKASAEKHLAYLKRYAKEPFVLAVSDQLHVEEEDLEGLSAGVVRFRNMPLADEVARLAEEALRGK